jgi:hypothetical protein
MLRYNNFCARRLSSTTMIPLATGPGKDKYPSQTRVTRVLFPQSSSKDFQHPLRATEDTTARGSAPYQLSANLSRPVNRTRNRQIADSFFEYCPNTLIPLLLTLSDI